MALLRPYELRDRDAVYDICVRTAHLGGDARPYYQDPNVLPEIFAGPYLYLEPELAFVITDGVPHPDGHPTTADHPTDSDRAVGYILGTADTATFVKRFATEWIPRVEDRYPPPGGDPVTRDEVMAHLLHTPERMIVPELADYPAHLHIDLLPAYQHRGHGRALVDAFTAALRRAGAPALHLGMVTENRPARAFYDRLGFHVIDVPDPGPLTYLGLLI